MAVSSRLWALRKRRPLFVAVSAVALALLTVYPAVEVVVRSFGLAEPWAFVDYGTYSVAVEAWRAGDPIYTTSGDGGYWGRYIYPPLFLLVFLPFTYLPHAVGGLAWGAVSVLLLWIALQLVAARLGASLRRWERLLGLWLLVGFHPLLLSVKMGQTGGFLAAMLAFAAAAILGDGRARAFGSGALTAFVGTFKLAYAPVGLHLLTDRRRLVGALAAGVALAGLSVALFGVDVHRTYLDVLAWGLETSSGFRPPEPYLWLPPYYRPLSWVPGEMAVRFGIAAGVSLAALAARDADREVFVLGVATFLLITPLPYVYYLVAALPAVFLSLAVELERDGYPTIPVLVVVLFQLQSYGLRLLADVVPDLLGGLSGAGYLLLQPGLWGALLFFGLAVGRVVGRTALPTVVSNAIGHRSSG